MILTRAVLSVSVLILAVFSLIPQWKNAINPPKFQNVTVTDTSLTTNTEKR